MLDLTIIHQALNLPAAELIVSDHGTPALLRITRDGEHRVTIERVPLEAVTPVRALVDHIHERPTPVVGPVTAEPLPFEPTPDDQRQRPGRKAGAAKPSARPLLEDCQ